MRVMKWSASRLIIASEGGSRLGRKEFHNLFEVGEHGMSIPHVCEKKEQKI